MKSFWNVLKKATAVASGVSSVAVPIVSLALPQFAPALSMVETWVAKLQNSILTAEQNNPVDGQGQVKSMAVIADFEAGLEFTNSILAARGKKLDYDKAALQEAINSFVAGYNALAKVKASFKEISI